MKEGLDGDEREPYGRRKGERSKFSATEIPRFFHFTSVSVQTLRAWMAWWVVIQHLLQASGFDQLFPNVFTRFLTLGGLAVIEFVIISGFVVTHLLVTRHETYIVFIVRRFARIYPLYLVVLLCAYVLIRPYGTFIAGSPWANLDRITQWRNVLDNAGLHMALHALLIQGMIPDAVLSHASQSILAPAWSLSLEWQYYLIAPLVVMAFTAQRAWAIAAVSATFFVAMIITYHWGSQDQWEYPAFLPLIVGMFLLGTATRFFFEGQRWRLIPVLVVTVVNFWLYALNYAGGNFVTAVIPLILWFIVLSVATQPTWLPRWCAVLGRFLLEHHTIVNLGLWSYATYLLHTPLFVASLWLLHASGYAMTQYNYFTVLCGACVILVPLSYASYHLIEQPCIRFGNHIASNRRLYQGTWPLPQCSKAHGK